MKLYNKVIVVLILIGFLPTIVTAQERYTLSGIVKEAATNETMIGVTVAVPELQTGVITNEYGFYSITLPKGDYTIQWSFVGFNGQVKKITLKENTKIDVALEESSFDLDEVVIVDDVEKVSIRKPEMSVNKLSINTIKQLPVVFGEVDVVKSLLLLPGVTSGGEGASGFNVRGGASDQNLILLDEATIFNSSHLFGFFSVFNPDAIKDLKLYKGGIPARYGGRVSSVLDIYQKDGNSKDFHLNGGIGVISSRVLLEGPIVKDRGSFLLGGRSSYAHLFLPLVDNENVAYFYDVNVKLNYKLNDKNTLLLSGYFGRDVFSLSENFVNTYGNSVLNLRWNHIFNDQLFSNLSLIYSDYFYGLMLDFIGFDWESGIQNLNVKYDLKHYLGNSLKLNYGLHTTYHSFNPGEISPIDGREGITPSKLIKKFALENAVYLGVEQKLTKKLTAEYGLRYSTFLRFGQSSLNRYQDDQAVIYEENLGIYEGAEPIGAEDSSGDVLTSFGTLEPRLALSYLLSSNKSIKASYNRIAQYLHLLSNTSSPTPLDVWTPSGPFVKPQIANQVALGYFQDIKENAYTLQVETFYKTVENRINYIDGADLIANDAIERVILNGEARAYGLEVLLTKNRTDDSRFTGWLAYTLSRSEERTPGRTAIEPGINFGEWYASNYDKTHDISMTMSYKASEKWSINTNFSFQTGQPTTYPNSQYEFSTIVVPNFSLRNSNRLPSYHRLDISATLTPKNKNNNRWRGEWVFGIYNIYNRKNAASITFSQNKDTGNNEATKLSIFGIVPSVTYNFKF